MPVHLLYRGSSNDLANGLKPLTDGRQIVDREFLFDFDFHGIVNRFFSGMGGP